MPLLIDANSRSVCLHLVNVPPLYPDSLNLLHGLSDGGLRGLLDNHGLLNDNGLLNNGLLDHRRGNNSRRRRCRLSHGRAQKGAGNNPRRNGRAVTGVRMRRWRMVGMRRVAGMGCRTWMRAASTARAAWCSPSPQRADGEKQYDGDLHCHVSFLY